MLCMAAEKRALGFEERYVNALEARGAKGMVHHVKGVYVCA